MLATKSGRIRGENLHHQSDALYQITHINAARQTGISPPTRITNHRIVTAIMPMRIQGVNALRKSVRKIISIITFDPLTTMRCMSPEALRLFLSSQARFVFCQRIIPERRSCHSCGKISSSFWSKIFRKRTNMLYLSGGVFSILNPRNSAISP